ncbi:MAG: signal peptidase II [Solobacterium sp.]|nr:signal peptidase II [Solobacterium sp.]
MLYFLIVLLTALDQLTKIWIQNTPEMHVNVEIIRNFFYITYVKNTGAAWSMLAGHQVFLSAVAAAAILVMFRFMLSNMKKGRKVHAYALAMMIAGAAGNLIDRLMLGYVRDFLNFYIFGYDFPVFNVADCALTVGVIILMICMIFEKDEDEPEQVEAEIVPENEKRKAVQK